MPDIDPAALSRPSVASATPILPPKSLSIVPPPAAAAPKVSKSNHVPPRIDMEPLYKALKAAVGEHWGSYQEAISLFVMGELSCLPRPSASAGGGTKRVRARACLPDC